MSIRTRVADAVYKIVERLAPQCLEDAWGGKRITVTIPSLYITVPTQRKGGYVQVTSGMIRVHLIAERPDLLPGEALWAALAVLQLAPDEHGMQAAQIALSGISERIDGGGWCTQELDFSINRSGFICEVF